MRRRAFRESMGMIAVALVVLVVIPRVVEPYVLLNLTAYFSMAVFALSLALVWGFGGIACYGQASFFGLGCYSYAIAAINFGDTTLAVPLAVAVPAAFSVLVGYFVFYGRLTPVYTSVVTLCVSLVLFKLISSTAGHGYVIGKAALGGFNGISNTPILNRPFDPSTQLSPEELFAVTVLALLICYLFCKWILVTRFGRAVIAVRENEMRAELLGYDARALKLGILVIGAALAGISGILFANSVYVSPNVFGLFTMAQSLIWVVVGGVGTLMGPVLACVALSWLTADLGANAIIDPNIVLGLILVVFVRFAPNGLQPTLDRLISRASPWGPTRLARRPTANAINPATPASPGSQ